MKKKYFFYLTIVLPFFLVWAAWVLTAFSFDPREVFQTAAFWGLTMCYYFVYLFIAPTMYDAFIKEDK
jgi:hypothetical protein